MEAIGDFCIREAAESDKEAVLGIRENVYGGRDYLHDYYDDFVSSPHVTPFILLDKEKIVGFNAACIVDDGSTNVNRAGRIKKEYEGRELYGYLTNYIGKWAKSKGVLRTAFTASANNQNLSKPSFRAQNQLILSKTYLIYTLQSDHIKFQESDIKLQEALRRVSEETLQVFLGSENIKSYLFPEERISVNSVPFQLLASNIPLIIEDKHTTVFSSVQSDTDAVKGLLSFGTLFKVQAFSFQYSIDLYGTDTSSIRQHIIRHLWEIQEKATGRICIIMSIPKECRHDIVDEIFSEFGGQRENKTAESSKSWTTCDFLFEKQL